MVMPTFYQLKTLNGCKMFSKKYCSLLDSMKRDVLSIKGGRGNSHFMIL